MEELKANSGLYIEKMGLADAFRFSDRRSEMIRQLMLELVGPDNLKKMASVGNKNRAGIPEKIRKAVFCKSQFLIGIVDETQSDYSSLYFFSRVLARFSHS